jgi:exodeoxyribonuclease VII large subunit
MSDEGTVGSLWDTIEDPDDTGADTDAPGTGADVDDDTGPLPGETDGHSEEVAAVPVDPRRVWSVGEIVGLCKEILEEAFNTVLVRGEISSLHQHRSGHWYFKLKDEDAVLDVAMFRGANREVAFSVEDGLEVIAGGRLTIYPPRGNFQMVIEFLEPVGWGALQLAFEQLKTRLLEEGLFEESRKRPIPLLPRCVGVVTSDSGAAWRDLCRVWQRREVPIEVILAPAKVQGDGAAAQIAAAIEKLNRHGKAEVMIIGRGGGSREDLWAFNEEIVARAIAASRIPVISAVGHEIDITIADLVADRRAATPTAAAEVVAASRQELLQRLQHANQRASAAITRRVSDSRSRLNDPRLQRRLRQPAGLLNVYRQRLDDVWYEISTLFERSIDRRRDRVGAAGQRLALSNPQQRLVKGRSSLLAAMQGARAGVRRTQQHAEGRFGEIAARVEALSPLGVLARGYSICERSSDSLILRHGADVEGGDQVRIRLHEGRLVCRVEEVIES